MREREMATLEDFEAAKERLRKGCVDRTPIRKSHWLSEAIEGEVFLKLECLHEPGSFKLRGVVNYLLAYREEEGAFPAGVMTASGGNHGLAVACGCQRFSIPCTVVLPKNSVTDAKVSALEKFGARVEVHGDVWNDANDHVLQQVAGDEHTVYVHPFDHKWIRQGTGTILLEVQEQLREMALAKGSAAEESLFDAVVASVGGGGLLSGMMACAKVSGVEALEFGCVETEGTAWLFKSMAKGELVCLDTVDSIASTLGAKSTSQEVWDIVKHVSHPMMVTDAAAVASLWDFLVHEKLLVEPATSVNVAALLQHKDKFKGKKVVLIVCGTGVTYEQAVTWKKSFNV